MIESENITKYEDYNEIYVPEDYNNNNYKYYMDNETITIITNQNCYTNYNTTYCDCYRYNEKYNIISESYSCNSTPSNSNNKIAYTSISSDINDSYRATREFKNNYTIMFLMIITILIFVMTFKKNSRRI